MNRCIAQSFIVRMVICINKVPKGVMKLYVFAVSKHLVNR